VFFYLCKVLFLGFLQFNSNFVDAQNYLKYRDWAPLNAHSVFTNSSGLKSVFEKLRFRDGLVWTVSLPAEIKLSFLILQRTVNEVWAPPEINIQYGPLAWELEFFPLRLADWLN